MQNWYKIAQEINYAEPNKSDNVWNNWWNVGHREKEEDIVWLFDKGKLLTAADPGCYGHGCFFGEDLDLSKHYRGRFEEDTGRLSIARPIGKQNNVPTVIMDILRQTFKNITSIYVY